MSGTPDLNAEARQLKRKNKVRAAWISFIGRIVAQVIGAVASVTLGLMLLSKYSFPEREPAAAAPAVTAPSTDRSASNQTPRASSPRSIAVMPFQNFSRDASHAYFADGVTETLITELAQISGLYVTSRTSSMTYKATTKALPVVARELGVALILEGSVVRDQALVRVTAQLIDAATDQHLWARSYDRPVRNLLPVQADVARSIVRDISSLVIPGSNR